MADRVIVVGAKRARQQVPASEMKQMIGRAGRRHDGGVCRATIVVEEDIADVVEAEMGSEESMTVASSLFTASMLAFHLLPEICNGSVENRGDMEVWYSRSLGRFQHQSAHRFNHCYTQVLSSWHPQVGSQGSILPRFS